jgi:hypothetical protein
MIKFLVWEAAAARSIWWSSVWTHVHVKDVGAAGDYEEYYVVQQI